MNTDERRAITRIVNDLKLSLQSYTTEERRQEVVEVVIVDLDDLLSGKVVK